MKLKTKIRAEGIMGQQCAQLTIMYRFVYEGEDSAAVRFLFPVPDRAVIYGLQLLTENSCLTRGELLPWSEAACTDSGIKLLQYGENLYELWFDAEAPSGECSVLISLICPTEPTETGCRLALPFAAEMRTAEVVEESEAEVCLTIIEPYLHLTSPSHNVIAEGNAVTVNGDGNRDFVLDAVWQSGQRAEVSENFGGGILACRLRTQMQCVRRKLILIPDFGGDETSRNLCKQMLYKILCNSSGYDMAVFLNGYTVDASMYDRDEWYRILSEEAECNSPEEMPGAAMFPDAVRVWICGANACIGNPDNQRDAVLLTVGERRTAELAGRWQGLWRHFYPEDTPAMEASAIPVPAGDILVRAADGVLSECCLYTERASLGYVDVFAAFSGKLLTEYIVCCGKETERVSVTNAKVLPENRLPEQLFAGAKSRELARLATDVSPESLHGVKRELERIGIQYEILNRETVFAFSDGMGKKIGIPMLQCSIAAGTMPHRTIFGEEKTCLTPEEREKVRQEALQILLGAVRSDGAIADASEEAERANQTAYAAAVLSQYDIPAIGQIIAEASRYLAAHTPSGYARVVWENRERLQEFSGQEPWTVQNAAEDMPYCTVTHAAQSIFSMI